VSRAVHCALVHHPVRDREGNAIASAVTNLDVHDIARSARTYRLAGYWVISPIAAQRLLVDRILDHWKHGAGARRVPERAHALAICAPVANLDAAIEAVAAKEGTAPEIWVTEARSMPGLAPIGWDAGRTALSHQGPPVLLLFGTAHGLHASVLARADVVLAPIEAGGDYNHLSVRAAAAITFDRLFGERLGT
jgi:hypothetical protein